MTTNLDYQNNADLYQGDFENYNDEVQGYGQIEKHVKILKNDKKHPKKHQKKFQPKKEDPDQTALHHGANCALNIKLCALVLVLIFFVLGGPQRCQFRFDDYVTVAAVLMIHHSLQPSSIQKRAEDYESVDYPDLKEQKKVKFLTYVLTTCDDNENFYLDVILSILMSKLDRQSQGQNVETDSKFVHLLRKEFHLLSYLFQNTLDIGYVIDLLEENTSKGGYMKLTDINILMHYCHLASVLLSAVYSGTSSYDGNLSNERENNLKVPGGPASSFTSSSCSIVPDYDPKRAVHARYKELQSRIKSFEAWPDTHAQSPREMAVAGFFYTGHADLVRCHYCDLPLEHWDLNHQPLLQHVLYNPFCGYVQFVCRDDFIRKVLDPVDKKEREQLCSIPESAKETSSGAETGIPRSDPPRKRKRLPHPGKSLPQVKRFVRTLFSQCGHVAQCLDCPTPPSRCPTCPTTKSSKALSTAAIRVSDRKSAEKKEPTDEKLADEEDSARLVASKRVPGESGRPSSNQLQPDTDPPFDLLIARTRRDAIELSALFGESSCRETKTGDTESEGNQDGNGQDVISLVDPAKMCALHFPLNTDISIRGTKKGKGEAALISKIKLICVKPLADIHQDTFVDLHQTKPLPIQGDDGRSESNPLVTEHTPHFPAANDEASQRLHENDDANEVVEEQSPGTTTPPQQVVQDVLHAIQEATRGFKHPIIHQMLAGWQPLFQEITAQPVVPQSAEEGLARVDFRSPARERMNVEGFRVGTFLLYPRAEDHAVLRLANAGFYYTGRDDTLACFCCDVIFSYADRRPGEDPYDIHRQLNPNCPHLTRRDTGNVFIHDEQTCATSGRDITSEGNDSDEPNIPTSQMVAEAIARIRNAVSTVYTMTAVPNATSQNQSYLFSVEPENVAQNNINTTHGTNRSFEEPTSGQNRHDPLIETISNAYENSTPASPEGRTMGRGNNERPRQGNPSFPQSENSSGGRNPASVHQTSQAGVNGRILNPPSTNIQEISRPLNEPTRSPVLPQPSTQVRDNFQHSSSSPQPPVSASSTSIAARQGEVSPPSANPAATESDYDPSRAVHPQYTDLQRRQNSFGQWPDTHAQSPEELAVAGFFFTGIGDCVRCHYCGLGLKHWDPDDRPLDEHVRWRSSCGYLRALCGNDVIYRTLARLGGGRRNGEAAPAPSGRETVVAAVMAPPPTPGLADNGSQQTAPPGGDVADLMTSEAAEAARGMGFSNDAIERAIRALLGTRAGRRAVTTQNLANAIIYLQGRGRDPESPEASDNDTSNNDDDESGDDNGRRETGSGNPGDSTPPHSPSNSGNAGPSPVGVVVRRSSESPEGSGLQAAAPQPRNGHRVPSHISRETFRQLEQENRDLRDRRRCKICLDNDVSILFLPCGHLVCCAECAPALRRCPMCRRRITGTVRIQLASVPPASAGN